MPENLFYQLNLVVVVVVQNFSVVVATAAVVVQSCVVFEKNCHVGVSLVMNSNWVELSLLDFVFRVAE